MYKNKYRIPSARLRGWDYASQGAYFVTICTRNRVCWFGEIRDAKMVLSDIGKIIADEWLKTEQIRPNVELDEWQVMPNHIHGIIILNNKPVETPRRGISINTNNIINTNNTINTNNAIGINDTISENETTEPVVCTGAENKKSRLYSNSIGAIIGQFKSVCTKRIWKSGHPDFNWQTRFHDRIIRDEQELNRIREYIRNNPAKWEDDRYHPDAHQKKS